MVFSGSPPRIMQESGTDGLWWLLVLSYSCCVWQTGALTAASQLPLQTIVIPVTKGHWPKWLSHKGAVWASREARWPSGKVAPCTPRFLTHVSTKLVVGLYHDGGGELAGVQAGGRLSLGNPNVGGMMLGFRRPLRSLVWSVACTCEWRRQQQGRWSEWWVVHEVCYPGRL